jgi:hypothetical protein
MPCADLTAMIENLRVYNNTARSNVPCPSLPLAGSMSSSAMEYVALGTLNVPRIWNGLWQLSSNAWGSTSAAKIRQAMARHVELGYTAFGTHCRPTFPRFRHDHTLRLDMVREDFLKLSPFF